MFPIYTQFFSRFWSGNWCCCNTLPSDMTCTTGCRHCRANISWSTSWHQVNSYSISSFSVSRLGDFVLYSLYYNVHCNLEMTSYEYVCRLHDEIESDTVTACAAWKLNEWMCVVYVVVFFLCVMYGAGMACWLKRRTCDRKVASSNPRQERRDNFLLHR